MSSSSPIMLYSVHATVTATSLLFTATHSLYTSLPYSSTVKTMLVWPTLKTATGVNAPPSDRPTDTDSGAATGVAGTKQTASRNRLLLARVNDWTPAAATEADDRACVRLWPILMS